LSPAPLGLIRRTGNEGEINVDQAQMGTTYMQAFTKSMKHLSPDEVKVSNIRGKEGSLINIIENLKRSTYKVTSDCLIMV